MGDNAEAGPSKIPNQAQIPIAGYRSSAMKQSKLSRDSLVTPHVQGKAPSANTHFNARRGKESYDDSLTITHSQKQRLEAIERKQEREDSDYSISSNDKPRKRSPRDDTDTTPRSAKKVKNMLVTPISKRKPPRAFSTVQQQRYVLPARPPASPSNPVPSGSTPSTESPSPQPPEGEDVEDDGTQDRAATIIGILAEAHDPSTRSESPIPAGRRRGDGTDHRTPAVHPARLTGNDSDHDMRQTRHDPTSARSRSANASIHADDEIEEEPEIKVEGGVERRGEMGGDDDNGDYDDVDVRLLTTPSSPLPHPPATLHRGRLNALVARWLDHGDMETFDRVMPLIQAYFKAKEVHTRAREELDARRAGLEAALWEVGEGRRAGNA